MGRRTHGSPRRLDRIDRQSQVGVSGAMRARDVSRPAHDDNVAASAEEDEDVVAAGSEDDSAGSRQRDSEAAEDADPGTSR